MLENLLFPRLTGKWKTDIKLNKYAQLIQQDVEGNPFVDPNLFGKWIDLLHKTFGVKYSWGGWLEDRQEILEGTYLPSGGRIHLGVDFWVPEGTTVHLPKIGKLVKSRIDLDQDGGWGGQVIFEINGLYYIFGHLRNITRMDGEMYPQGAVIGTVAEIERSGGWYPHLHLQCMRHLDLDVDGYSASLDSVEHPDPYKELS